MASGMHYILKAVFLLSICSFLPIVTAQNSTTANQPLRVCVVERSPFSRCAISNPKEWEQSYMVKVFQDVVDGIENAPIRMAIRQDWQCVGKSTADLVEELSRPQSSRSCDIVVSPITITEERKAIINFVNGVYYTYALPLGPANERADDNEISFWLRPFQTAAWLTNLGLLILIGICGGLLALFLQYSFQSDNMSQKEASSSKFKEFSILTGGSITSVFGQHPSHGVISKHGHGSHATGAAVAMAAFFAAAVFAVGIVTMQYAGNLAAIQSQPTVVPVFDSVADLFGQKVLTSTMYGSQIGYNFTLVTPTISNNDDVLDAVRDVDQGKADAFVWDALVVLSALDTVKKTGEKVCVFAMKKRIYPFEIGFGVGKDVSEQTVKALQDSLNKLDASGELRNLRTEYLDGLNQYVGKTVCPGAKEGLTAGQTAGVYIVPGIVLACIVLLSMSVLGCNKLRKRRASRRDSVKFDTSKYGASKLNEDSQHVQYPPPRHEPFTAIPSGAIPSTL